MIPNLVEVNYGRTGRSTNTDALGMREMQARAFAFFEPFLGSHYF